MAFERPPEQQAVEDLYSRIGALQNEVRFLKAALNNRDMDIRSLKAENARLVKRDTEARNTLQAISDAQVPDQPATSPLSDADYVRRHYAYLRSAARAFLAGEGK